MPITANSGWPSPFSSISTSISLLEAFDQRPQSLTMKPMISAGSTRRRRVRGRNRPRPRPGAAVRRAARRPSLRDERDRPREHVPLHAAARDGRMTAHADELVLIVDDNDLNLRLARDVLRHAGFRTLEARSGLEAIELAGETSPTVVLMDVRLPDMDGIAALDHLRS